MAGVGILCIVRFLHVSAKTMGIQGLSKVLGDYAPSAIKENDIKNYFGRYTNIYLHFSKVVGLNHYICYDQSDSL